MNVRAKRFALGVVVSALLLAMSWIAGGLLPDDTVCLGCRVPMGAMVLMVTGCIAVLVDIVGYFALRYFAGSGQ